MDRVKEIELRLENMIKLLEMTADEEEKAEIRAAIFGLTMQLEGIEQSNFNKFD